VQQAQTVTAAPLKRLGFRFG